MPAPSQYQNVFRVEKIGASQASNGMQASNPKAKRNRQPLSCESCRAKKLKCDRQFPCGPCSRRGDAVSSLCHYGKSDNKANDGHHGGSSSQKLEVQLRLQKLEHMVTTLMQTPAPQVKHPSSVTESSPGSIADDLNTRGITSSLQRPVEVSQTSSNDRVGARGSEARYQGATHWTTILENIREIQGCLDTDTLNDEGLSLPNLPELPDIAFEAGQALTLVDVCLALPQRHVADKLLSIYFNSGYLRSAAVHGNKFLREYESFWADSSSASFLWLSMLFSILWTGSQQDQYDSVDSHARTALLRMASQTLVAGGYQKARPYSVEAVLLYGQCKYYLSREDANTDAWMIMGIGIRLGMKMGYHREPYHFANTSPFEGEMRRRTFFMLDTFDTLLSLQAGLPAIVQEHECDTGIPRNLFDEDFDEDCEALPPSRPPTDSTPMLYFCYKSRFSKTHRRTYHQADIHFASQPGRRFANEKLMFSSITLHDFLSAAMIICLDLYETYHNKRSVTPAEPLKAQTTKYDALRLSYEIWTSRRAISRDADQACKVLAFMLSKVPRPTLEPESVAIAGLGSPENAQESENGPEQASSNTVSWTFDDFGLPRQDFSLDFPALDFDLQDPLNGIFEGSENVDWGFLDQYL